MLKRCRTPLASGSVELGVAEAEADAEPPRLVEQRLRVRAGHRRLVEVVELADVGDEPPGEERRQGQLGEDDEVAAPLGGLLEQGQQALDDVLARVVPLDGAELGRTDGHRTRRHGCM